MKRDQLLKTHQFLRALGLLLLTSLMGSEPALAQEGTAIERGDVKFQHSCAPCHARGAGNDGHIMLPGTEALQIKYGGAVPPALEDRSDLPVDLLLVTLRQGSWSMPPFRPTELTDAEIEDIAAYLAESSKAGEI